MPYSEEQARREIQQIRLVYHQNQEQEAVYNRSVQFNERFANEEQLEMNMSETFFLEHVPYLPAPEQPAEGIQNERRESRSERKKRESLEKQRRKAAEATRDADMQEGSAEVLGFRAKRHHDGASTNSLSLQQQKQELTQEKLVLEKRMESIQEQEKADLLAVELAVIQRKNMPAQGAIGPGDSEEALKLQVNWKAQLARVDAYRVIIGQLPLDSKERTSFLKLKEDAVLQAGLLKRKYEVACMPEGREKAREAATIVRHGRFDMLKSIFRTPSRYSHEGATVITENGVTLVNVERATLGGTKAMYIFQDMATLVDGRPQEWLFKEATNCVGMDKPEGAVVTGEASKLQQLLRGELSIPAQCLKDEQGKVVGSIQKRVKKAAGGIDLFKWQAQEDLTVDQPSETTMNDLMNEHTLDWMLCNFDTKGENFINQPDDHIISFDKEASFNTLLQDGSREMSYTFKPHSNDTIYNTMFRAFAEGKINLDLNANINSIARVEAIGEDAFINMFRETLDTKYKQGTENRAQAEANLRERYRNLRQTYSNFYRTLIEERLTKFAGDTPEEEQERARLNAMIRDGNFVFAEPTEV